MFRHKSVKLASFCMSKRLTSYCEADLIYSMSFGILVQTPGLPAAILLHLIALISFISFQPFLGFLLIAIFLAFLVKGA